MLSVDLIITREKHSSVVVITLSGRVEAELVHIVLLCVPPGCGCSVHQCGELQ